MFSSEFSHPKQEDTSESSPFKWKMSCRRSQEASPTSLRCCGFSAFFLITKTWTNRVEAERMLLKFPPQHTQNSEEKPTKPAIEEMICDSKNEFNFHRRRQAWTTTRSDNWHVKRSNVQIFAKYFSSRTKEWSNRRMLAKQMKRFMMSEKRKASEQRWCGSARVGVAGWVWSGVAKLSWAWCDEKPRWAVLITIIKEILLKCRFFPPLCDAPLCVE